MGKRSKRRFKGPCCRKKTSDSDVEDAATEKDISREELSEGHAKPRSEVKVKPRPKKLSFEEEIRQQMAELDKRLSTSMRDLFSKIDQHSNIDAEILNKVLPKRLHITGVKSVQLAIEEEFRGGPNILRSQFVLPEESKLYGKPLRLYIVRAECDENGAPFAQVNAKDAYEAVPLQPESIGYGKDRIDIAGLRMGLVKPDKDLNVNGLEQQCAVKPEISVGCDTVRQEFVRSGEKGPKVVKLLLSTTDENDDRLVRLSLVKPEEPVPGTTGMHDLTSKEPTHADCLDESSILEKSSSTSTADTVVSVESKCIGPDIAFTNEETTKDGSTLIEQGFKAGANSASTQTEMINGTYDSIFPVDGIKVSTSSMVDKGLQVRPEVISIACGTTRLAESSTPKAILKDAGVQVSDLEPVVLRSFSTGFSSVPAILLDNEISHVAKSRMKFACGSATERVVKEILPAHFDPKDIWDFTPFDLYCKRLSVPVLQHKGSSPFKFMNAKHNGKSRLSRFSLTIPPVESITTIKKTTDDTLGKLQATSLTDHIMEPDIVMPIKHQAVNMEQKPAKTEVECFGNNVLNPERIECVPPGVTFVGKRIDEMGDVDSNIATPTEPDHKDTVELLSESRKDVNGGPINETFTTDRFQVPNLRMLCKNMFMEAPSYVSSAQSVNGSPKLSNLALGYIEAAYQRFKTEAYIENKAYTSVQSLRAMCRQLLGFNSEVSQGSPKHEENKAGVDKDIAQDLNKQCEISIDTRLESGKDEASINSLGRGLQKYPITNFDIRKDNNIEQELEKDVATCSGILQERMKCADIKMNVGRKIEKGSQLKGVQKVSKDIDISNDFGNEQKKGLYIDMRRGLEKEVDIKEEILREQKKSTDIDIDLGKEVKKNEDVNTELFLEPKKDVRMEFGKELVIDINIPNGQEPIDGVDKVIKQDINRCAEAHLVKEPDQNKPDIDIDVGDEEFHINKDNTDVNLASMDEAVRGQFGAAANLTQRMTHADLKVKEMTENTSNDLVQFRRPIPELKCAPKIGVPLSNIGFTINLRDLMEKYKDSGVFTELHAQFLCINILRKLKAFHSQGIIHASITPRRVVFNAAGYPTLIPDIPIPTRQIKPRIEYSSPEHISSDPITMATDIFQTGLLVYTVFTGKSPYLAETHEQTKENLLNGDFTPELDPDRMSKDGRYFVRKCLKKNPDLRFKLVKCRKPLEKAVKWFSMFKEETLANQTFPSPFKDLVMAQLT